MYDELIYNHLLRFLQQKKGSVISVVMHDDSYKKRVFSCGRSVTVVLGLSVLLGGMTPAVANADEAADSIVAIEEIIDQNLPDAATFALDVTTKADKGFGTVTFNLDMAGLPDTTKVVVRYSGSDGELITRTITSGEPLVVRSPDQGVHYVDTTFDYQVYLLEEADGDTDEVLTELEQFSGSLEIKAAPKEEVTTPEGFPTQGEPGESVIAPDWINKVKSSHKSQKKGEGTIELTVEADDPPKGVRLEMDIRTEPTFVGDYEDIVTYRVPVKLNEPMSIKVPKDGTFDVTTSVIYGLVVVNDKGDFGGELSEGGGIFDIQGVTGDGTEQDDKEPTPDDDATSAPPAEAVAVPEWINEYELYWDADNGTTSFTVRVDGEAPDDVSVLLRQRVTPLGPDGPGDVTIIETPISLNETVTVSTPEGAAYTSDARVVYELVVVNANASEQRLDTEDSLFVVEGVDDSEDDGDTPAAPGEDSADTDEPITRPEPSTEATDQPADVPTQPTEGEEPTTETEKPAEAPADAPSDRATKTEAPEDEDATTEDEATDKPAPPASGSDQSDTSTDEPTRSRQAPESDDDRDTEREEPAASPSDRPNESPSATATATEDPEDIPAFVSDATRPPSASASASSEPTTTGTAAPPLPGDGVDLTDERPADSEAIHTGSQSGFDVLKYGLIGFAVIGLIVLGVVFYRRWQNRSSGLLDDEA